MTYFNRQEFECQCGCGFNTVDFRLAEVLDQLREHFDKPVTITSGCRCKTHNWSIGGSNSSQHCMGKAADIKVKDISPSEVYKHLSGLYPNEFGLGLYKSWVHIDVRTIKGRWNNG